LPVAGVNAVHHGASQIRLRTRRARRRSDQSRRHEVVPAKVSRWAPVPLQRERERREPLR
jgi:hypothetical protein